MSKKRPTPQVHDIQARLGSGAEAIAFALQIDDHFDLREFLQGWLHGDLLSWPEFDARKPDCKPDPDGGQ